MANSDFQTASSLLPKKIDQVFDQPKIGEMILAFKTDHPVKLMIQFELINLASLMSVGGNLNKAQVFFIAEQLMEIYPNESIADFKLCFQRGAMGLYGDIQRMDGITIGGWMKQYLDEKYQALENALMKERENLYKPVTVTPSDIDWHKKWLDELPAYQGMIHMTDSEIKREGKEKPLKQQYQPPDEVYFREQTEFIYRCQERSVRERHPEWDEEQIQVRLAELKALTTNSTDFEKITGVKFKSKNTLK